MLIRSQDKTRLINTNEIYFKEVGDKYKCKVCIIHENEIKPSDLILGTTYGDNGKKLHKVQRTEVEYVFNHDLGTYSTKEQAMKVMDMIESDISTHEIEKLLQVATSRDMVFQMPQDSEVK